MSTIGSFRVANRSTRKRRTVETFRIPLARDTMAPGAIFRAKHNRGHAIAVADRVTYAEYPGDARSATCWAYVSELAAGERVSLQLNKWETPTPNTGGGSFPAFEMSDAIRDALFGFRVDVYVSGRPVRFSALQDQGTSELVARTRLVGREPLSGFWCEWLFETPTRMDWIGFTLRFGFSDDSRPEIVAAIDSLEVAIRGAFPVFWFAANKGLGMRIDEAGAYRVILSGPQSPWGDAQAPVLQGRLLFVPAAVGENLETAASAASAGEIRASSLLAETEIPCMSVGEGWKELAVFGPYGTVPTTPWLDPQGTNARESAIELAVVSFRSLPLGAGLFLRGPHMAAERPGNTGDQADFGLGQLFEVVESGEPDYLFPVRLSSQAEASRPIAFREQDVSRVQSDQHPGWFCWQHYTHYHESYRRDRLGKPAGQRADGALSHKGNRWVGWDPAHESINYVCALALLTADTGLIGIVTDWIETYKAQRPIESGTALDGMGSPRAIGRETLAACWAYLASGREDVLERAGDRLHLHVAPQAFSRAVIGPALWPTRDDPHVDELTRPIRAEGETMVSGVEGAGVIVDLSDDVLLQEDGLEWIEPVSDVMAVLAVGGPSPRTVPEPNWSPLWEGLAVAGVAALYNLTKDDYARRLCRHVSRTVTLYGVNPRGDGSFDVGGYVAWNEGVPLTTAQWEDKDKANVWGDYTGKWLVPCFHVARAFALQESDQEWLARCDEFLTWYGARRGPPSKSSATRVAGGWDELTPWWAAVDFEL